MVVFYLFILDLDYNRYIKGDDSMRKSVFLLICILGVCLLVSCDKKTDKTKEESKPESLSIPNLYIDYFGVAIWDEVPNAISYEYVLNGEVGTTKNTSITLNENDKFKVKAIGDNERYLDSKYSIEITCAKIKASENLVFELSADESYYILTGKGSCLDTTIVIPDNYNGLPVKTIGEAVFADYSRLVTLIIPHTITSIEKDAFNNCSGLVDLVIPRNLTYIGENAFNENNNLTNIYFNGTMKNWLKLEFENETLNPMYYAKNLYMLDTKGDVDFSGMKYSIPEDIIIDEGVTELSSYNFYNLKDITSIVIPSTLTNFGLYAFAGCEIYNLYYNGTLKDWLQIEFLKNPEDMMHQSNPMSSAQNYYFKNNSGDVEFNGVIYEQIINIEIPDSVEEIKSGAFANCVFEDIIIPNSVKKFNEDAFNNASVKNVYFNGSIEDWLSVDIENEYATPVHPYSSINFYISDKNGDIQYNNLKYVQAKDVYEVNIQNVESISSYALSFFKNLKNVVISNDVKNIKPYAFECCSNIENVYYNGSIEDWLNLKFEDSSANPMKYAKNLFLLDENGDIEYNGLKYNTLKEIVIPSNITSINFHAFTNIKTLEYLVIPNSVKEIHPSAFTGCTNLKLFFNFTKDELQKTSYISRISMLRTIKIYVLDTNGDINYNGKTYSLYN